MATTQANDRMLDEETTLFVKTDAYWVGVWRSITLIGVTGELDDAFLPATRQAHDSAVSYDRNGYGAITIAELSAKLPSQKIREEATKLRIETQEDLRAQAVVLAGEGFFASAIRAAILGILSMAKSRVPMKMTGSTREAAQFVASHIPNAGFTARELERVIELCRMR